MGNLLRQNYYCETAPYTAWDVSMYVVMKKTRSLTFRGQERFIYRSRNPCPNSCEVLTVMPYSTTWRIDHCLPCIVCELRLTPCSLIIQVLLSSNRMITHGWTSHGHKVWWLEPVSKSAPWLAEISDHCLSLAEPWASRQVTRTAPIVTGDCHWWQVAERRYSKYHNCLLLGDHT